MNGYQVCRTLRAEGNWTPILMLTAKTASTTRPRRSTSGPTTSCPSRSRSWCWWPGCGRWPAGARRPARRCSAPATWCSTPPPGRATGATSAVRAHAPGAGLLEALLRRPGEVVPKRELLREVWGDDFDGDANVVEVYVGYLRRKVDAPFGRRSLQTVRGAGYRVAPMAEAGTRATGPAWRSLRVRTTLAAAAVTAVAVALAGWLLLRSIEDTQLAHVRDVTEAQVARSSPPGGRGRPRPRWSTPRSRRPRAGLAGRGHRRGRPDGGRWSHPRG